MTPENQKKYDEKVKRVGDAVALKEPDRVPIMPAPMIFPVLDAGYTVAEVVYDTSLQKMKDAVVKYLTKFDPDSGTGVGTVGAGEGPALELVCSKNMRWAGMPGDHIDKNSLPQFIEYPLLHDDEYGEFFSDRTGWAMRRALPRMSGTLEPLSDFRYNLSGAGMSVRLLADSFSGPEFRTMIQTLWDINDFYKEHNARVKAFSDDIEELGYPIFSGIGGGMVPFDFYSDFLRGTILTMEDLYERPEAIERFIDEQIETVMETIQRFKDIDVGKHVFMALHKGFDGFLNNEHYRKYYWKYLQKIMIALIDVGKIPYVFAEGKYDSRIDCLTEIPPGKVVYHFEKVDLKETKRKLGGIACIAGSFPAAALDWETPEKIRDMVKQHLDEGAPGGGFIFMTSCGMGKCKRENVEAMFETLKEYGVY